MNSTTCVTWAHTSMVVWPLGMRCTHVLHALFRSVRIPTVLRRSGAARTEVPRAVTVLFRVIVTAPNCSSSERSPRGDLAARMLDLRALSDFTRGTS